MITIFKKIINKTSGNSVGSAALIVSVLGLLSRALGFIRDRMLTAHYGAGDTLDVYYAAFRLPDSIFELLVAGTLGAALIPVLSEITSSSKDMRRAWRCANGVIVVLSTIVIFLSVMSMIFAPQLVHIFYPGFPAEKMNQTVSLVRIMFLSPIFFSVSAVLGNVLIYLKKFVIYSTAPLFYNFGIIIGIIFLAPNPKLGNIGLAIGVVLGAFMHFLFYFISIRLLDFKIELSFSILKNNYDAFKVFKLMLPRLFGSAYTQISPFLINFFTSYLATGSLTIFNLANNIQGAIVGLVGVPFALASFSILSESYFQTNYTKFSYVFSKTLRRILYYVIPLSFTIFILREQVVRIAYGAGKFDLESTKLTAFILGIFCISLFAQSLIPLLTRGFFAMQDTYTPLYVTFFTQFLNFLIILLLIEEYKLSAVAVAFSVSAISNALILFVLLIRKNSELKYFKVLSTFLKIIFASVISSVAVYWTKNFIGDQLSLRFVWQVFLQLVIPTGVGLFFYLIITALMKMDEFETIRKKIFIRIFGEPQVATEEQNTIF